MATFYLQILPSLVASLTTINNHVIFYDFKDSYIECNSRNEITEVQKGDLQCNAIES